MKTKIICRKDHRLRDLVLIAFVLVTLDSDIGWAQQVEPLAGTWKTWVLASCFQWPAGNIR